MEVAESRHDVFGVVAIGKEANQRGDPLLRARKACASLAQIARRVAVALTQVLGDLLAEVVERFRVTELLLQRRRFASARALP